MSSTLQNNRVLPKMVFRSFSRKYCFFLKNLFNNKISGTWFVVRKVVLIFCVRRPISLKHGRICPQNRFCNFLRKYYVFRKTGLTWKYLASNLKEGWTGTDGEDWSPSSHALPKRHAGPRSKKFERVLLLNPHTSSMCTGGSPVDFTFSRGSSTSPNRSKSETATTCVDAFANNSMW